MSRSDSVRGTPSTSATALKPNVDCSAVCLKTLFSATCGIASRLSSIWMRIPERSEWSARSETSVMTLSLTRSAIFLITPTSPPFFTPYGSSVTMIADLPPRSSSMCARAHHDPAAPRAVRLADALAAQDDPAGREVRSLDVTRQPVDVDVRLVDQRHERVDHLAEVVRRDVRRHADGDAGGAVDEQVREPGRKNRRLPARLVVVRLEVDRVRVDVAQQLGRDPREP